jgi:hypothetical protein
VKSITSSDDGAVIVSLFEAAVPFDPDQSPLAIHKSGELVVVHVNSKSSPTSTTNGADNVTPNSLPSQFFVPAIKAHPFQQGVPMQVFTAQLVGVHVVGGTVGSHSPETELQ